MKRKNMKKEFYQKINNYVKGIKKIGGSFEDVLYENIIKRSVKDKKVKYFDELVQIHTDYKMKYNDRYCDMFGDYLECQCSLVKSKGQVFTPKNIVDFMVQSVIGQAEKVKVLKICDPACGTGKFMLGVARYLKKRPYVMWNVDIDFRMYVFTVMNAVLNNIPAVVVYGDVLMNNFQEAVAVIPDKKFGVIKDVSIEEVKKHFVKK